MKIRTIIVDDYPKLAEFWQSNYFLSEVDSFTHFSLFLEKNPNLSVLIEENDEIIGTALGSFDGRRGYLQKVVTKKDSRNNGIGLHLVKEVIKRLQKVGAVYVPISVEEELASFYKKCGFLTKDSVPMTIDL